MEFDHAHALAWFESQEESFVEDVFCLAGIPSVSDVSQEDPDNPFGEACSEVVRCACQMAQHYGLHAEDLGHRVAHIRLKGRDDRSRDASDNPEEAVGFFSHIDVVPAGQGWSFDPFEPFIKDGWLFGRGVDDNKGPAMAVLYALRYFLETGIRPHRDVVLYLGADEERAMEDLKWLVSERPMPRISLVSDAFFPVCIGEKGVASVRFAVPISDPALQALQGGEASNVVPACASAVVATKGGGSYRVEAQGVPAHAARPEGSVNAVGVLAHQLARNADLRRETRDVFECAERVFSGYDGAEMGVDARDDRSGDVTVVAVGATLADEADTPRKKLVIDCNVRFPPSVDWGSLDNRMKAWAQRNGWTFEAKSVSSGFLQSEETPLVRTLCDIVNQELGTNLAPYAMAGATHARLIPDAIGFGPGRSDVPRPFPEGRGGAHQPDEAVSLESLRDAFMVYAQTIAAIDAGWDAF